MLLQVFLRSGQLTVYEVNAISQPPEPIETPRPTYLNILFNKVSSIAFEIHRQDEGTEKSIIAEQKRVLRNFVPFVTNPGSGAAGTSSTYTGVFLTGDRPNWILATNQSGLQIYPSGHSVVHAFTTCSLWDSRGDFLLYTEEVRRFFLLSSMIRVVG